MRSALVVLAAVVLCLGALAQQPQQTQPPATQAQQAQQPYWQAANVVVATVDGRQVTSEEVTRFAWQRLGRQALEGVIDEILIRRAAAAAGIEVSDDEVQARIRELAEACGGEQALIAKRGVAGMAALREQVRVELLLRKLVERVGRVSEQEAQNYYRSHIADYTEPARWHVYVIVVLSDQAAQQALSRIKAGEKFEDVARQVSVHPSAERGGDLGWITADELPGRVLQEFVKRMEPGRVSVPLPVDGRYWIVKVAGKRPERVRPFEEVRDEIVARIRQQRGITPQGVLAGLRRRANIRILIKPFAYLNDEFEALKRVKIYVCNEPLKVDVRRDSAGRILVPVKPVLQALGATVKWVPSERAVVAEVAGRRVRLAVGEALAQVDGKPVNLGAPVQMVGGKVWAVIRPIVQALGGVVCWDPVSYELFLYPPVE